MPLQLNRLERRILSALYDWHFDGVNHVGLEGRIVRLSLGVKFGVPGWLLRPWVYAADIDDFDGQLRRCFASLEGLGFIGEARQTAWGLGPDLRLRRSDGKEVFVRLSEGRDRVWTAVGTPSADGLVDAKEWPFEWWSKDQGFKCYALTTSGVTEARTLQGGGEKAAGGGEGGKSIKNKLRHGGQPKSDPKEDEALVDAYKSCGAKTYQEGVNLLASTFTHLSETELKKALDRHRKRLTASTE